MSSINRTDLLKELAELEAKQKAIHAALDAARDDELKTLVDAFKAQLEVNKFELEDALELLVSKKTRAKRGSAAPKPPKEFTPGTSYKNPKGDEVWVGGTKGRKPLWLSALLDAGSTFESLAV